MIVSDIGNVLYRFDMNQFIVKLKEKLNEELIADLHLFSGQIQKMQDNGIIDLDTALGVYFKVNKQDRIELIELWNNLLEPCQETIDLVMNEHYALLSNMGIDHFQYLKKKNPKLFENGINHISCEVGLRKPNKLFFQSFLLDHPEFKNSIYIDDIQENLHMGAKYGLTPWLFTIDDHEMFVADKIVNLKTVLKNHGKEQD